MGKMKTAFVGEDSNKKKEKEQEKVHLAGLKGGQKVKVVEAAPGEESPIIEEGAQNTEVTKKSKKIEHIRGKKYKDLEYLKNFTKSDNYNIK